MFGLVKMTALAAATFLAAPAMASTIYSGTIDESNGRNSAAGVADFVMRDFNTNVANPGLDIGGETSIYGYVAHKSGSGSKWKDGWTMNFGAAAYDAVFNWQRLSKAFEGSLTVSGTEFAVDDLATGTINLGVLTGSVTFSLDPVAGIVTKAERATWDLQLTNAADPSNAASPVPLPAGAMLMLTGVAGFAALRRRKTV